MPTIRELVKEAEENFGTGRHGNSAPLFKRAGLQALNHGAISDALYLIYRALHDYDVMDNDLSKLQLLDLLISELYNKIKDECSKLLQDVDHLDERETIQILKLQVNAMDKLDLDEEKEVVIRTLVSELQKHYQTTEDISYLEEVLKYSNAENLLISYLKESYDKAKDILTSGSFDVELVAYASILQALKRVDPKYHDFNENDYEITEILRNISQFLIELSEFLEDSEIEQLKRRYEINWI